MNIEQIVTWILALPGVRFIAAHVLINVVAAVAVALKESSFDFRRLGAFLTEKLAPYILVYAAASAVGQYADMEWLPLSAWALIHTTLLADLADNLSRLGLPIPSTVINLVGTDTQ